MDDSIQRKIELQSPDDLRYLITNVRKAATDSINAAFPPVLLLVDDQGNNNNNNNPTTTTTTPQEEEKEEDELRNQIEKLVNEYITKTFTLALPSLSINGSLSPPPSPATLFSSSNDPSHHEASYEPFDPRKRDKIEALVSQEEDLLRSIAQLKRRVPAATASAFIQSTNTQLITDEELLQVVMGRAKEEGLESGRKALEGMGELDHQEDVEQSYTGAVDTLGRIKTDMPAVVAKMERARVAGGYVVQKKSKK